MAGILVSCGSGRPRTQSTKTTPTIPTTTATVTRPKKPKPAPSAVLPWPTYGADNARLRAVAAPGLRPPFRRLWTFHGRHLLEFPPVVGYGSVFEEAFDGRLYAIDPATGKVRWLYTSHRCGWSSPAVADHLLFATFIGNHECHATRAGGELVALSPETGRIRWRRAIGPSESSPLVAGGMLYVADQDGYVSAFTSRTGRLRWRFATGAPIKASPSLAYGRIYIGDYAGEREDYGACQYVDDAEHDRAACGDVLARAGDDAGQDRNHRQDAGREREQQAEAEKAQDEEREVALEQSRDDAVIFGRTGRRE